MAHAVLLICKEKNMARTNSNNDSPKGADVSKRKFSQSQYDMLKRCSDKKDMTEWNQWRKENPDDDVLLEKANLQGFYLTALPFDNLQGADLSNANLQGTDLSEANLRGADLSGANLQRAKLSEANLQDAKLWYANLQGANLSGPNPDLSGANLQRADLSGANLQDSHLRRAYLQGAKLPLANLKGAFLVRANLQGADLSGSKLYGANLWQADLNQVNMYFVKFDSTTRCRSLRGKDFYGSPVFKRFVEDSDYLEDFKRRHPAIYWIWFVLSDCGRSIGLWAAWSLAFAVFFAHVFYSLGPGAMKVADLPWNFSTVVYYSVVTFTTLGFGDVVPTTNAAAWWVMAEVITGYVMLGGLISIFANKLARRS